MNTSTSSESEFPNIISIYQYGSYVYGTSSSSSDLDFVVVVKDLNHPNLYNDCYDILKETHFQKMGKPFDFNFYTDDRFVSDLNNMEIAFLECTSSDENLVFGKKFDHPQIDKFQLRRSVAQKCSNSWVKAKKKLQIDSPDYDLNIGRKSLFHSIRMFMFGLDIAHEDRVSCFWCANHFYHQIMEIGNWEGLEKEFKKVFNSYASDFRKACPLEEKKEI
jgi:predicted nucleotidyltransferase